MKCSLILLLMWSILGAGIAAAQNSDLGLLVGVNLRTSGTVAPGRIEGTVSASGQINYAIQLREAKAGVLYLELPLLIADTQKGVVAGTISSSSSNTFFLTPGVRWHYTIHPRVALYGSVGGGIAILESENSFIGGGIVSGSTGTTVTGAFGFGGGLDFRLTRLLSLRAEARNFVTRAGLGGETGHNHTFITLGVGFHF
ncbi:MAG TPA: outer membrane beta-barrel protein [Bryobacteraceae bacterium]|nr:outer membrane beta-barrel protein [Bryobacteraceae bacterium]